MAAATSPPAINIFEDLTRVAAARSTLAGNTGRHAAVGQLDVAEHADSGDQHYGRLGERSVKQCIVDGYNGIAGATGEQRRS